MIIRAVIVGKAQSKFGKVPLSLGKSTKTTKQTNKKYISHTRGESEISTTLGFLKEAEKWSPLYLPLIYQFSPCSTRWLLSPSNEQGRLKKTAPPKATAGPNMASLLKCVNTSQVHGMSPLT